MLSMGVVKIGELAIKDNELDVQVMLLGVAEM
jgi:hypothetical protein